MPEPFLFVKTGTIEAEPHGFYDDLAERYAAKTVSSATVRDELFGDRRSRSRPLARAVNEEANSRVRRELEDGSNVVYDSFLMSKLYREKVMEEVVKPAGATAILLVIRSPFRVIKSRILDRYIAGDPVMQHGRVLNRTQGIEHAHRTIANTEWPTPSENPLNLDGTSPTQVLLDQVAEHVEKIEGTTLI